MPGDGDTAGACCGQPMEPVDVQGCGVLYRCRACSRISVEGPPAPDPVTNSGLWPWL